MNEVEKKLREENKQLIEDLKRAASVSEIECEFCKHGDTELGCRHPKFEKCGGEEDFWEWRGVEEDEI